MSEEDRGPAKGLPLDEVSWTSPPLGSAEYSRSFLEARFGEPQLSNLDSNGLGPFDAWLMRFDSELEVRGHKQTYWVAGPTP